jgi:hypothetical protein
LWLSFSEPARASGQATAKAEVADTNSLLQRVKTNLQRERQLLLEYSYREKRRPIRISALGKVSLGDELVFEVLPSGDPDRPRRILLSVNGRPPTPQERAEEERRHNRGTRESTPDQRAADERRAADARRKAQERFEDAFRVYRFVDLGAETLGGQQARVVSVEPRPDVETKSDLGDMLKNFRGRAWVIEPDAQLVRLELEAVDSISIGWGVVARIAEGTHVTYERRAVAPGLWFPARGRVQARGRTLLFRSFAIDSVADWFDYQKIGSPAPEGGSATPIALPLPAAR